MKVLIVDENPYDLLLQAELLALKGFTVVHAKSAVSGMKAITTEKPDLIVADMPPVDPAVEDPNALLRAMVTIYDLPMIALSYVGPSTITGASTAALGCIGQIAKPIDIRTFAEDVLSLWQARPQTSWGAVMQGDR